MRSILFLIGILFISGCGSNNGIINLIYPSYPSFQGVVSFPADYIPSRELIIKLIRNSLGPDASIYGYDENREPVDIFESVGGNISSLKKRGLKPGVKFLGLDGSLNKISIIYVEKEKKIYVADKDYAEKNSDFLIAVCEYITRKFYEDDNVKLSIQYHEISLISH